ncbi:hypothetical protein GQ457_05G015950 [Hibiscus cannabinus]
MSLREHRHGKSWKVFQNGKEKSKAMDITNTNGRWQIIWSPSFPTSVVGPDPLSDHFPYFTKMNPHSPKIPSPNKFGRQPHFIILPYVVVVPPPRISYLSFDI